MAISKDTVKYVAHLARIKLATKELDKLSVQLEDILKFIDKIKKAETKDIQPTSHILRISNVLREDEGRVSLAPDKVLSNASQREGNFFVVPKVIE